eukprot:m.194691 g.194691  ORF g.194691 m.194691 type:complete len:409 (-) comp25015_c0_seq19:125-1351(-)
MKKQSGRGGPALNAEASATAEKKKLFHRFKKVKQALVAVRKNQVKQCNRGVKRLEAKASDGSLTAACKEQLSKLQARGVWLRGLDGDAMLRLCGLDVDTALAASNGAAATPVKIDGGLDPRQHGLMQKMLQDTDVAERLRELQDGPQPRPDAGERKRKRMADEAETAAECSDGSVAGEGGEKEEGASTENPYAHWATAASDEELSDDGDAAPNVPDTSAYAHFGEQDEVDEAEHGGPVIDDDDSGMFMSSLSAGGSSQARRAVNREVFVGIDRNAPSTTINDKKKKNRPGQIARQKRAEVKHGDNAAHVRDPSKDATAKQQERRKKRAVENEKVRESKRSSERSSRDSEATASSEKPWVTEPKPKAPKAPAPVAADDDVHPSWAAKKLQKEKASAAIQPFKGTRITFD